MAWAVAASWLTIFVVTLPSHAIAGLSELASRFQIADYLRTAAELQALPTEARVERLREIARDPIRSEQLFPLSRMLFEAKPGGEFRRPMIGGAVFVGGTSSRDWPLEPIVLYEGIPILVVKGYALGGKAETAAAYLDYCFKTCRWRRQSFIALESSQLRALVNRFLDNRTDLSADANWVRQQAVSNRKGPR